jgi:uncharacterized membrane protein AbrB (regulator of aidB expression)
MNGNGRLLAFAPGGIAEMSTTAIALHTDSTFVIAVQSIRLMMILILLPTLFRFINKQLSTNLGKETMNRTIKHAILKGIEE